MNERVITSRSNPLIQEVRSLAQKKYRTQRGEFLIEGIQPVLEAIESHTPIRLLLVAPDLLESKLARDALRRQERTGMRIVQVSSEVFESLAEREHPTGLAAVVKTQSRTLADLSVTAQSVFVALYQISNPGNLGTILRTADAVKASGAILIGNSTDPYAPTALNASRGAIFTVPLVSVAAATDLLVWCRTNHLNVVTTSDRASQDVWSADLQRPMVLVFGNEGEGLPQEILAVGNTVRIPMYGAVDSLNVAVAAGVLLYECARRTSGDNIQA